MGESWSVEQIVGLAPDRNSAAAGHRLATARGWSGVGYRVEPAALWGLSQGSAAKPYQTVVDLTGPAYSCSCPSRKFPCKHALALMLLWSAGQVSQADAPAGFAAEWLAKRAAGTRAGSGTTGGSHQDGPVDPKAAAKRADDRAARITAGLEELDQWLCDQVRTGLSNLDRARPARFETIAARMVDAQAPGVASRVRRLPAVLASGEGWHGRLLEQFALLRLLVRAHRRLAELPAPLAAAVRAHVGYPMPGVEVLALAGVRDTWSVLGLRDEQDDRLLSRRVWLQGATAGRMALVLTYAPIGRSLDDSLTPGMSIEADLHFYPGGFRALVGTRHDEPGPLPRPVAVGVDAALGRYAAALAADPWLGSWPVLLGDVAPVLQSGRWAVRDEDGDALPLAADAGPPWTLLACSGGEPVTVAGEWTPDGLVPLSVIRGRQLVRL